MKFTTYLSAILLTSALAACQVTVETDDPYDGSSGGLQIDAGSFTMGLDKARNFDVDGGNNGVIWGTFTGTGQPVCFVVDADADFVMTVGRESKWYAPDFDGSDTGSFDQEDCSQYSSGNEPAFCWFRTQQDISYVMQVSRYYSTETTSWATVAVVDGPCPAEVDEAVFTYDEEASGSSNFENHQVEAITLTEGMSGIATATFDAEGRDVEGGFSATFMSTGGPVCFAMDSDVGNNIIVAEKSRLDDNPYPDSATVGSVEAVHIECKHYSSGSTSEPAFCGLADTSAGKEYIVLAESYYSSETKMMASLAAISGPCPYVIDEAVFTFDEESSGSNVFENYQVAEGDITGFGENFAIEEKYSLTDQIRRSSRSVCANLAEAYRKRRYPKNFLRFDCGIKLL